MGDNFEFNEEQQYPPKSAAYNRMIYDIIRQIQTVQGVKGDEPAHEWDGTRLRFQNPDGTWGAYVDLNGDAGTAPAIQAEYSIDGSTNWHVSYVAADKYFRHSYDSGASWEYSILFKGTDGTNGLAGDNAPNTIIQFSIDGATLWHAVPVAADRYFRFSVDNGSTYTDAVYYYGNTGAAGVNADNVSYEYRDTDAGWTGSGNSYTGTQLWIRISLDGESTWSASIKFVGADGADGTNQYLYVAWADDDQGAGFTLTFNASKDYRAEVQSTVVIPSPNAGNFTGLWKYNVGEDGADGQSVYKYEGYASDLSGSDFTLVNDPDLDFHAILLSLTVIPAPVVGDFAGLWYQRKGDNGSNASYIELPSDVTVTARCAAIIAQPVGWTMDSGDQISNPLSSNPIDLVINHGTGKEVVDVIIKSKTVDHQIKLIGAAAYSTFLDDDTKNYLCIKSLSETLTILGIYILFES